MGNINLSRKILITCLIFTRFENREKYNKLIENTRLNESKLQAEAVKRGLIQIIPEGLISLLTWRELEIKVCGKPDIDLELLKMNTEYRGCSEKDPVIQNFWKTLEDYSSEERTMYLRFVWGRSRLPLTSKDFPMKHRVEMYLLLHQFTLLKSEKCKV